jgi:alkylation response protein AidB-like acyl-CoA dehydrogenase
MTITDTPAAATGSAHVRPRYHIGSELGAAAWAFNEEHLAWRQTIRKFARERVAPGAAERSKTATFDRELVRDLAELGVFGLLVPEPHGYHGDLRMLCIALEELAYVDSSAAVTVHVGAVSAAFLAAVIKDRHELSDTLIPKVAAGELFCCIAITEPSGGSDAANVTGTIARRDGDGWILNGAKQFITNSGTPLSQYVIVISATGDVADNGRRPVSAFLVPLDTPGVTVAAGYDKFGWRASDTHPIFFDSVRLPEDALISPEGGAPRQLFELLTWARIPFAAMGTGLARACLDESLRFTGDRNSFGAPVSTHQGVSFELAGMAADVHTAMLQTYDAAWKHDNGLPVEFEAAASKLIACELANSVAYRATQLHGGYGFMQESAVVRHYQDARVLTIAEGTSQVQRMLISRYLGASK